MQLEKSREFMQQWLDSNVPDVMDVLATVFDQYVCIYVYYQCFNYHFSFL